MSGTHAQRIVALLLEQPGLDDDQIARVLGIEPRQTVNQVCRRLEAQGALRRERVSSGKIGNFAVREVPTAPWRSVEPARSEPIPPASPSNERLAPSDLKRTLLIIPCSGAKRTHVEIASGGDGIAQSLPDNLSRELLDARSRVCERVPFDDSAPVPAWQRYDGALYQAGRKAIGDFIRDGAHVAILSGGYGVVLAGESIGMYEAVLTPSWWPDRIIERVLLAYVERHQLTAVRAIVSATGPYSAILRRVSWKGAGVADALLISPHVERGALRRSPATQGEAITALYEGTLSTGWRSSYGLGLNILAA